MKDATDAAQSLNTPEKLEDIGVVRSAFEKIVTMVENSPSLIEPTQPAKSDRHLVRTLRERHHAIARLTFLNDLAATEESKTNEEEAPKNFLEAEVVAIYW